MLSKLITSSLMFTLTTTTLCACPADGDGTTTDAPETTTAETLPGTTETTGDADPTTSATETTSTGEPDSTSSTTEPGDTSTVTTNDLDPLWCDEILGREDTCEVRARTFCGEVAIDADVLPEPYRSITTDKCEDEPCAACFYLANTCQSLMGKLCEEDLYEKCVCLAEAHGVI